MNLGTLSPLLKRKGLTRSDMDCHNCSKGFVAELDHSVNGNHIIECPYCGHEHYRVMKDGIVTQERWDSSNKGDGVKCRRVWKHDSQPIQTSTASAFIRDRLLNPSNPDDDDDW